MTRIAKALRLLLAAEGIDQNELAEAVGTSASTVSRFLRGENIPEAATMLRIVLWLMEEQKAKQCKHEWHDDGNNATCTCRKCGDILGCNG